MLGQENECGYVDRDNAGGEGGGREGDGGGYEWDGQNNGEGEP